MATTKKASEESASKELFVDELKDIYWVEKPLTKALIKMADSATSETSLRNRKPDSHYRVGLGGTDPGRLA
jgi:ferritin-like metal-binding protein YciE